ncbi:unnamed protein product [Paramecium octaurelia]|uniref:Uncharacterized protein n=1 Tax=Paramecium octaurelia TaxID=43137 RepID=A0A8S1XRH7_PAROT|nr:unnamed protein product [Paramecium octaurelia]
MIPFREQMQHQEQYECQQYWILCKQSQQSILRDIYLIFDNQIGKKNNLTIQITRQRRRRINN